MSELAPRGLFGPFRPSSGADERRTFIRMRLALYCQLMFWSFAALIGFINVMYAFYAQTRPAAATTVNVLAGVGMSLLLGAWLFARRERDYPDAVLTSIDLAATAIIGLALAASAVLARDRLANVYSAFIWVSFAVFGRSLVVPSSGRRTAVLGAIGIAPMLVTSLVVDTGIPRPALFVGAAIFCAVVVILSTVGSHVIYGLRQQVREAMQLGQYTIGEKLGEGGMGAVYKAHHALLRRPTAIKLVKPELAKPETLARFEREVQATSELEHPNTIAIYDYGRSPDGIFYYAMEYLDGIDLERLVTTHGPLSAARVVHVLEQVCGALAEAHERGLIHRDIKPSNIILCCRAGIPDVAKILDFGLVKDASTDDDHDPSTLTGTPAYLSPEAIDAPERVSARSDLYALGATAYFLLTGSVVFAGKTVIEVCYQHLHTAPARPSERTANPIPDELEALVLECLAKDPAERPTSARFVGARLASLAASRDWDAASALAWWEEVRKVGRGGPSGEPGGLTMTVDLEHR